MSRWGRFQDADESAYYEFLCKEAGITTVHYCAEQFENDGSLSATIIKSMKRAMAGEYSRELSAKVFAGQCRLIGLGYRQGDRRALVQIRSRNDNDLTRQYPAVVAAASRLQAVTAVVDSELVAVD